MMFLSWTTLKKIWDKLKNSRVFWAVVALVVAFIAGFLFGNKPAEVVTKTQDRLIEDVESKQKLTESLKVQEQLRQQLTVAEKTISEMKVRTVEKVRIVYQKDGDTVVEKEKTTDIDQKTENDRQTEVDSEKTDTAVSEKEHNSETKSHTDSVSTVVTEPKDKFFVGVSGTIGLSGLSRPGLEFKYRLLDLGKISVWTGAEAFTGPPQDVLMGTEFRGSVGISF